MVKPIRKPLLCVVLFYRGVSKEIPGFLSGIQKELKGHNVQAQIYNAKGTPSPTLRKLVRAQGWAYKACPDSKTFDAWVQADLAITHADIFLILSDNVLFDPSRIHDILKEWDEQDKDVTSLFVRVPGCPEPALLCRKSYLDDPGKAKSSHFTLGQEEPPPPIIKPDVSDKISREAVFFVATNNRPALLASCLRLLKSQENIPDGWRVNILVAGQPWDPGRDVAFKMGIPYLDVPHDGVTDKLNRCLQETSAELVLMADDDDLQPPNRAAVTIKAYEQGSLWGGSGSCRFVHTETGNAALWEGRSKWGLVGTTMFYGTRILKQAGGWPHVSRGKDGPLAQRIQRILGDSSSADLTSELTGLVCTQHGGNLWHRPFPDKGTSREKGGFRITGEGPVKALDIPRGVLRELSFHMQGVAETRIHVSITTYERPGGLKSLLDDLVREGAAYSLHVTVYDDQSKSDYQEPLEIIRQQGWKFIRTQQKHGKRKYTQFMNRVLNDAATVPASYRYFLQDDIRLCRDFFPRTIGLWEGITDIKKATLYLLRDPGRSKPNSTCWTDFRAQRVGDVECTQWTDAASFMFGHNLWTGLPGGTIPPPPASWFNVKTHGSGFGRQISRTLVRGGYNLYRTLHSMVAHLDQKSVMNPEERAAKPMYAVNYVDGEQEHQRLIREFAQGGSRDMVTASMATFPARKESLMKTVAYLLPQVDQLNVYLNGYIAVPPFLRHPKITAVLSSQTPFGDRGDAGKFYWADSVKGFHLTVDDDLLYPPDYVQTLVRWVTHYKRKAVVGCHGAVITEPFVSYYRSRRVHHFQSNIEVPIPVHCLGTGTVCYHTDCIRVVREDFKHPNMADIWFAVLGQEQKVPFMCVAHSASWLRAQPASNQGDSIYAHSQGMDQDIKNTGIMQTDVVKQNIPWKTHRRSA